MPTKSDVMYQRVLYVKQLVKQISIKHYDQVRYAEIVEEIFNRNIGSIDEYKGSRIKWRDTEEDEDILCSDSSPCEYQTDEDGEPLADEVSGKESIVIEDDSVRGES